MAAAATIALAFEHACLSKLSRGILQKLAMELLCLIESEKLTQAIRGTLPIHKSQYFPRCLKLRERIADIRSLVSE